MLKFYTIFFQNGVENINVWGRVLVFYLDIWGKGLIFYLDIWEKGLVFYLDI